MGRNNVWIRKENHKPQKCTMQCNHASARFFSLSFHSVIETMCRLRCKLGISWTKYNFWAAGGGVRSEHTFPLPYQGIGSTLEALPLRLLKGIFTGQNVCLEASNMGRVSGNPRILNPIIWTPVLNTPLVHTEEKTVPFWLANRTYACGKLAFKTAICKFKKNKKKKQTDTHWDDPILLVLPRYFSMGSNS